MISWPVTMIVYVLETWVAAAPQKKPYMQFFCYWHCIKVSVSVCIRTCLTTYKMWYCEALFLQSLCSTYITNNLGFLAFLLQGIMMCNATLSSLSADTRGRHSRSFWGHYSMETLYVRGEDGKVPLMPKTIKERVLWSITQNTKKHTLEFFEFPSWAIYWLRTCKNLWEKF